MKTGKPKDFETLFIRSLKNKSEAFSFEAFKNIDFIVQVKQWIFLS